MPRYITPGDKVQFFEHEEEPEELQGEEVLEEYTEKEHPVSDGEVHEVNFNPNEKVKEFNASDPPNSLSKNKKSSTKELFFFLILLIIAVGAGIFLKG
jgi:hypothetical protein